MNGIKGDSLIEVLMESLKGEAPRLVETHISWVILAGDRAWKIKKPVDFGFLDFSTLEKRRACCEEEIRLNRRLAPDYYLRVAGISREGEGYCFDGEGPVVEYAVEMKRFDTARQLDRLLEKGALSGQHMDAFADLIADFHLFRAGISTGRGNAEPVCMPARDNFRHIENLRRDTLPPVFGELAAWTADACDRLAAVFEQRRMKGWVRECHGDLHLGNMAWVEEGPLVFDCIEFNEDFRWIDLMSEVAFLVMDLHARGEAGLAWRFLDRYLSITGDYRGLGVLPFYLVYRAMVRAKIAALRSSQLAEGAEKQAEEEAFERYLQLAHGFAREGRPRLVITRGLSGAGKSTVAGALVEQGGFIRLRSDVERKRLAGLNPADPAPEAPGEGLYGADMSARTYARLLELAEELLEAGWPLVVDATFLREDQRAPFQALAQRRRVPFTILELTASPQVLRQRLAARRNDVSDADVRVLEHQLAAYQPLGEGERGHAIRVDTEAGVRMAELLSALEAEQPWLPLRGA
ncbi:bifunctional aminoglycoside phosphotransferase/ATP-binding protein [Thiolapillus sp.]